MAPLIGGEKEDDDLGDTIRELADFTKTMLEHDRELSSRSDSPYEPFGEAEQHRKALDEEAANKFLERMRSTNIEGVEVIIPISRPELSPAATGTVQNATYFGVDIQGRQTATPILSVVFYDCQEDLAKVTETVLPTTEEDSCLP